MEQKHSDDLFREKLTDFSQHPDPKVWDRIQRSLDQRKPRRVLPIWWRLGGAAAILALALYLIVPGSDSDLLDTPAVSEQPVESPSSASPAGIPATEENKTSDGNSAADELPDTDELPGADSVPGTDELPVDPTAVAEQNAVKDRSSLKKESQALPNSRQLPTPNAATAVADAEGSETERSVAERSNTDRSIAERTETEKTGMQPSGRNSDKEGVDTGAMKAENEREAIASSGNKIPDPAAEEKGLAAAEETEEVASVPQEPKDEGQSIFEAIEEQEALAQTEKEDRRWTVGPSLAPVYFDSFGDGSPIAQNFVPNSKSGTMNMSYGMTVSYAVTEKLSLRSGVHRVDFGYNTDQVTFTSSLNAGPSSLIQTISYSENSKNLVVHSSASNTTPAFDENAATDVTAPTAERQGSMEQEFGYLEVPFELQYALIDKKFGLNLIGGMSSMFLVDNRVSLNSLGERTEMGEARNINSLNFSGNFGLGFTYNLNSALQLNMQPMFKYQLNTFSETAGNFRPFSVGVYSGLNFRF